MTHPPMQADVVSPSWRRRLSALAAVAWLGGCVTQPTEPGVVADSASLRLPPTQVYFYPAAGQTAEQQDRDRYECYLWAAQQTGFDPSQPALAPHLRVEVMPVPSTGQDAVAGMFGGAILGAAVSRPHDAGGGALIGAILGTMLGAVSDASRHDQAQWVQHRYDRRDALRYNQIERRASDYRRAMAACLEGRGYTVH